MFQTVLLPIALAASILAASLPTSSPPGQFDQMQIVPLRQKQQVETGPFKSLMLALIDQQAVIREIQGEVTENAEPVQQDNPVQQQVQQRGGGAQVNALEIENKGRVPILVLAGTIVKGGRQDRQIGEDVVIPPQQTLQVKAFCIEHGRWNNERDGKNTEGQFQALPLLTNQEVRYAGQHLADQSQVWDQVAEINAKQGKAPATGTLLASLEDPKIEAHRAQLATDVRAFLKSRPHADEIVGIGYAAYGQIRSARWFANRNLFIQHQDALINTAVLDALTHVPGTDETLPPVKEQAFNRLFQTLQRAPIKETRQNGSGTDLVVRQTSAGALTEALFDWQGRQILVTSDVITTR